MDTSRIGTLNDFTTSSPTYPIYITKTLSRFLSCLLKHFKDVLKGIATFMLLILLPKK
jgi:hypothetical protein